MWARILAVQVALAIMKHCAPRLMAMREMEEMVEYLKDDVPAMDTEKLQVFPPPPPLTRTCTCTTSSPLCGT